MIKDSVPKHKIDFHSNHYSDFVAWPQLASSMVIPAEAKATTVSVSMARPQLASPTEIPAEAKATPVFLLRTSSSTCTLIPILIFSATTVLI